MKKKLNKTDFLPFKNSQSIFAMTAHVLYTKIDNQKVATFSKKIINKVIRKKMGFKGILISDDISMKALKFDLLILISIKSNLRLFINNMINPTLQELPLPFSTKTNIDSVFSYDNFAVSVNYYVLRPKKKKNS